MICLQIISGWNLTKRVNGQGSEAEVSTSLGRRSPTLTPAAAAAMTAVLLGHIRSRDSSGPPHKPHPCPLGPALHSMAIATNDSPNGWPVSPELPTPLPRRKTCSCANRRSPPTRDLHASMPMQSTIKPPMCHCRLAWPPWCHSLSVQGGCRCRSTDPGGRRAGRSSLFRSRRNVLDVFRKCLVWNVRWFNVRACHDMVPTVFDQERISLFCLQET